jgi:thioredoxin 1
VLIVGIFYVNRHDGSVVALTSANWQKEVVESPVPVVVDFWAPWCGPCRELAPVIEQVASRYAGRVKFAKLNVDEARDIADPYVGTGIPQVYLFKGGQAHKLLEGFGPGAEKILVRGIDNALR